MLELGGERIRATLRSARIPASRAAAAGAFLSARAPRVALRCTVHETATPALVDVELLAWHDKSGDVWQDLGSVLIEEGLAERAIAPR